MHWRWHCSFMHGNRRGARRPGCRMGGRRAGHRTDGGQQASGPRAADGRLPDRAIGGHRLAAPRVAAVAVAEAAVDLVDPALVAKTRRQAKTAVAAAPQKHPAPKPQDQPRTQPVIKPRPAVSPIKSRRKNPTTTATDHPTAASSTRLHKMKKSPQPRTRYHTLGSSLGAQSCSLA